MAKEQKYLWVNSPFTEVGFFILYTETWASKLQAAATADT